MKSYSIVTRTSGGAVSLDLDGRITLGESARALRSALESLSEGGQTRILLDLEKVSHLDSSGLGSLLVGYNAVKVKGGSIGLVRVPKHIRELLELSRLTGVFLMYESEEEGLRN